MPHCPPPPSARHACAMRTCLLRCLRQPCASVYDVDDAPGVVLRASDRSARRRVLMYAAHELYAAMRLTPPRYADARHAESSARAFACAQQMRAARCQCFARDEARRVAAPPCRCHYYGAIDTPRCSLLSMTIFTDVLIKITTPVSSYAFTPPMLAAIFRSVKYFIFRVYADTPPPMPLLIRCFVAV